MYVYYPTQFKLLDKNKPELLNETVTFIQWMYFE